MKAISYDLSIAKYLIGKAYYSFPFLKKTVFLPNLQFSQKAIEPVLNGPRWIKLKSLLSGICGSDLGLIRSADSFSMEPYTEFPFILGHENVAEIVELGSEVKDYKVGQRVIVNPVMNCIVHERDKCHHCSTGEGALCEHFADKTNNPLGPGLSLGYHPKTGGGWSDYFQAHVSQIYPIDDSIPMKRAVLADPLCSALQAIGQYADGKNEEKTVLIYGSGTLGLLSVVAIRALGLKWKIIVGYRYKFQAKLAKELGADEVIQTSSGFMEKVATYLNAKIIPVSIGKPVFEGGVDAIFDTIASSDTIDSSLRMTKTKGSVVLIGTALSLDKVDPTPLWFREVKLTGSCMSRSIIDPRDQKLKECYRIVQEMLLNLPIEKLVTHEFPLKNYREAIKTALSKNNDEVVKVVFNLSSDGQR